MIAPDMATMLSFVFTDATIPQDVLQALLAQGVETSFNSITVDGDTSTSDTLLLFATGKGARHNPVMRANDKRLDDFRMKLNGLLQDLAVQVVHSELNLLRQYTEQYKVQKRQLELAYLTIDGRLNLWHPDSNLAESTSDLRRLSPLPQLLTSAVAAQANVQVLIQRAQPLQNASSQLGTACGVPVS